MASQRDLPRTEFGEWLEDHCDNLHDLARSLHCPANHPNQWMVGRRKPTPQQIAGLSAIYNVDPDTIYAMIKKIPPDIEEGLKNTTPDVYKAVRLYL